MGERVIIGSASCSVSLIIQRDIELYKPHTFERPSAPVQELALGLAALQKKKCFLQEVPVPAAWVKRPTQRGASHTVEPWWW